MTNSKKYTWHKLAESNEQLLFKNNGLMQADVAGKTICLAKKGASILACASKCPHAGGVMADGFTDVTGNIVCPLHRYKFSLQNGRNVSGEGYFLKTYPVEIRADGVFVGIEEKTGLFNW
jgi:nitrite reductase/ring-hydroxylating ferredoxin subunit